MATKAIPSFLKRVAGPILGIAILIYTSSRFDFTAMRGELSGMNPWFYFLGIVGFYISIPLRALRWKLLLSKTTSEATIAELTMLILRAWFLNCAVPARSGDVYASWALHKNRNIKFGDTAGSLFAARILDLSVLCLSLLGLFYFSFKNILPEEFQWIGLASAILLIAALSAIPVLKSGSSILHRIFKGRFQSFLEDFASSSFTSLAPKELIPLIAITLSLWILEVFRLGMVFIALGLHPSYAWITLIALVAAILSVIPLSPGGLGTIELFYQKIFPLAGIPAASIGSVVLLDRFINYWFILLAGGVYLLVQRFPKVNDDDSQ